MSLFDGISGLFNTVNTFASENQGLIKIGKAAVGIGQSIVGGMAGREEAERAGQIARLNQQTQAEFQQENARQFALNRAAVNRAAQFNDRQLQADIRVEGDRALFRLDEQRQTLDAERASLDVLRRQEGLSLARLGFDAAGRPVFAPPPDLSEGEAAIFALDRQLLELSRARSQTAIELTDRSAALDLDRVLSDVRVAGELLDVSLDRTLAQYDRQAERLRRAHEEEDAEMVASAAGRGVVMDSIAVREIRQRLTESLELETGFLDGERVAARRETLARRAELTETERQGRERRRLRGDELDAERGFTDREFALRATELTARALQTIAEVDMQEIGRASRIRAAERTLSEVGYERDLAITRLEEELYLNGYNAQLALMRLEQEERLANIEAELGIYTSGLNAAGADASAAAAGRSIFINSAATFLDAFI